MNILVDTHVFLWWNSDASRLPARVRAAVAEPANRVFVSAASVWEIAIKRATGKLEFAQAIEPAIAANGFEPLAILPSHAEHAGALPRHHQDPFDRMLLAQAELEGCVLATIDRQLGAYGIPLIGLGPDPSASP